MEVKQEMDRLMEMYGEEDLLPELLDYVTKADEHTPFDRLQHPLVYMVPYGPHLNRLSNHMLKQKMEQLDDALNHGDIGAYVFLHERPYRLQALHKVLDLGIAIPSKEYWKLLREIWTDTENFWQNRTDWYELFQQNTEDRIHFMTEDDRNALALMPSKLSIYRGTHHAESMTGLSWTLDQSKAEWFATRLYQETNPTLGPKVIAATIEKEKVLGYLTNRDESEIVALPWEVKVSHISVVTKGVN